MGAEGWANETSEGGKTQTLEAGHVILLEATTRSRVKRMKTGVLALLGS